MSRVVLLGALSVFSLAGCGGVGGQVRAGIGRYEVGNYRSAAQICDEMAGAEDDMNDKARVRYHVYCGLTQYRLGHRSNALQMLAQGAGEYQRGKAAWLKPSVVDELRKALDDLEGRTPPVPQGHASTLSDARFGDY